MRTCPRERSLHTGEVVGSIPTTPTRKLQQIHHINGRSLPFPPIFRREQAENSPSKLGENPGSLFDRCSARNGSTHPRSPSRVATVTGTIFQSVVRQTTPRCRKIVEQFSPTMPIKSAAPLRIVIEATASGRKWTARLGDRVLCERARGPS